MNYVKIMLDGNNGGYANDWLLGDRKTGEIARFELGLNTREFGARKTAISPAQISRAILT